MADLEFDVAVRSTQPITFTLGGQNALLHEATEAVPATDSTPEQAARPEVRGKDDHVYTFNPPKNAVMMMPIMEPSKDTAEGNLALTRATFDWLGAGLSEADNDRIKKRLRDAKDDLDVDDLGKVVEALSSRVSGRPTT